MVRIGWWDYAPYSLIWIPVIVKILDTLQITKKLFVKVAQDGPREVCAKLFWSAWEFDGVTGSYVVDFWKKIVKSLDTHVHLSTISLKEWDLSRVHF